MKNNYTKIVTVFDAEIQRRIHLANLLHIFIASVELGMPAAVVLEAKRSLDDFLIGPEPIKALLESQVRTGQ